jgi:enoyl-CoA hydratase
MSALQRVVTALVSCTRDPERQIGTIELRKPASRNALTLDMITDFRSHLAALENDHQIKAIVIRGQGPDLCGGLDVEDANNFYAPTDGAKASRVPSLRARLRAHDGYFWGNDGLYSRVARCTKVTVLAANGLCHGPGMFLALCCDLVVAASDSRYAQPRWRHVGADGDLAMLINAVGLKRASEIAFCSMEWDATEALKYGLVDEVVAPGAVHAKADEYAALITPMVRDGVAAEKYVAMAALEKMHVGAGFAIATMMGAMSSNIHFRPGEYNFLKSMRDAGAGAALRDAAEHMKWTP